MKQEASSKDPSIAQAEGGQFTTEERELFQPLPLCLSQSAQGPGGAWRRDRKLEPYPFLMTSYMEQRELAFIEFLPIFSQDRNDCILLCRCSHIAELGLEANTD